MEENKPVVETTTTVVTPTTEQKKPEEGAVVLVSEEEHRAALEAEKERNRQGYALRTQGKKDNDIVTDDIVPDDEEVVDVPALVKQETDKFKQEFMGDFIDETLDSLASNLTERELIKTIYDNRIVKTGFSRKLILEDLQAAKILANKPLYDKKLSEINKARISETTTNTAGVTSGQNKDIEIAPELSEADKKILARHGIDPKNVKSSLSGPLK